MYGAQGGNIKETGEMERCTGMASTSGKMAENTLESIFKTKNMELVNTIGRMVSTLKGDGIWENDQGKGKS